VSPRKSPFRIKLIVISLCAISGLFFGCANADKKKGAASESTTEAPARPLQLVQKKDKVIPLDLETSTDSWMNAIKIDTTVYVYFYNRNNRNFYLQKYYGNSAPIKVPLHSDGPHKIARDLIQSSIHNLDSIFIHEFGFGYIINRNGEIVDKFEFPELDETVSDFRMIRFDAATRFKNGKLYVGLGTNTTKVEDFKPLRASYNFATKQLEELYLEEREILPGYNTMMKANPKLITTSSGVRKFFVGEPNHVFATTQVSDSLYEYVDQHLVNRYYMGDPNRQSATASEIRALRTEQRINGGMMSTTAVEKPPHYTSLLMDVDKRYIYRIFIHGVADTMGKNDPADAKVKGATLIALNLKTKKMNSFSLPVDGIYATASGGMFATKEGIHFSVKDQEVESEKRFNVFKIE